MTVDGMIAFSPPTGANIDQHVGRSVRRRRRLLGLTQRQLGDFIGIRFQQIHKYETGGNRISAARLWSLAEALDVQVDYFFEGLASDERDRPLGPR